MSTERVIQIRPGERKVIPGPDGPLTIEMPDDEIATRIGRITGFLCTILIGIPLILLSFILIVWLIIFFINRIAGSVG